MGKEISTQIQEAQRVPYTINTRWNTTRHILIKVAKIKNKEQILKAAREKQTNKIQMDPYKDNSWSFKGKSTGQMGMARYT